MTQPTGAGIGNEAQQRIIERALSDPDFRARLLENPREAIREALGISISPATAIRVVEEQPGEIVLVLPASPMEPGVALSDMDLEQASGGMSFAITTASTCCGICA
jgi:hypothetical protein